jgi:hypothetical protein
MTTLNSPRLYNLNGTNPGDVYAAALEALDAAQILLSEMRNIDLAPNGRDFQTSPDAPAPLKAARAQYFSHINAVGDLIDYLQAVALNADR